jgi:hypothetical protein
MTLGDELDRLDGRASPQIPLPQETAPSRAGLALTTGRRKTKRNFSYPQAFENPRNGEIIRRSAGSAMRAAGPALKPRTKR